MKIVINTCYGGYGLSEQAVARYAEKVGLSLTVRNENGFREYSHGEDYFSVYDIERNDPALVATVEELGEAANGRSAELKVVEIPDGIKYTIEEYDGAEWIAEEHRTWR